ncbi:MAG: phenylalanine--tRNA ligase subunit beta, partial [Bdellovibrionota bacterium]
MKIQFQWLQELVPGLSLSPAEVAEKLTSAGLEVERIENPAANWGRVVVGHVETREKHPNADRLSLCQVRVSDADVLQIVCGAANVAAGQKVAVALVGAELPGGMKIERTKIRSVESSGMICSEKELGFAEKSQGILVLEGEPGKSKPGTPLAEALGVSAVLEVSITPNRGDCLSALGLARELAAVTGHKVKEPSFGVEEKGAALSEAASVEVQAPELCPRYCARVIEGVAVGPSPKWLADRLEAHGIRSISNVVDITNYILLLYGQPLHAFDLDRVADGKIIVRKARAGEEIETLDGKKRPLAAEMLVISDPKGPIAVAGVMGGARSEINGQTKRILLESAYFEPSQVRRTGRALGLSSESSYRFERGVDIARVPVAMDHAAALFAELAGGKIRRGTIDALAKPVEPKRIRLRPSRIKGLLGLDLPKDTVTGHLSALGFSVSSNGEALDVAVPSFRSDITLEADLIEEIARLEGYGKIPETLPLPRGKSPGDDEPIGAQEAAESALAARGWHQAVHLSFIEASWPDLLGLPPNDPRRKAVRIQNPINEEQGVLRTAVLPSLLAAYTRNRNRGVREVRLFEFSRVFHDGEGGHLLHGKGEARLPKEKTMLALVAGEVDEPSLWRGREPDREALFSLKGDILAVGTVCGVALNLEAPAGEPYLHPGRCAGISLGKETLGAWGELSPEAAVRYGIRERVVVAELDVTPLFQHRGAGRGYRPFSHFPSVWRDLALLIPEKIPAAEILAEALRAGMPLAQEAHVFDEFRGKGVEAGQKSLGIRLRYGSSD